MALKPWPRDAIMVTAALAGRENREQMVNPFQAQCRECIAVLMVCSRTNDVARALSDKYGKPVMYFCMSCSLLHDVAQTDIMVDHRNGRDDWYERRQPPCQ